MDSVDVVDHDIPQLEQALLQVLFSFLIHTFLFSINRKIWFASNLLFA
jgi:hypothetical protein